MTRLPIEGDKVVSRDAQKSTIGKSVKEYLSNILVNGIVPTFLMSCFPVLKRETYGQLQEAVMGTWLCENKHYTISKGIDEHIYQK
jgi:DNA-directed RNA polymerase beta subunit